VTKSRKGPKNVTKLVTKSRKGPKNVTKLVTKSLANKSSRLKLMLIIQEPEAQLDTQEQARLDELESTIEQGLQRFYEIGKALDEICQSRLYRQSYKNFEAYCRDRWGIARQTAHRFIAATQVVDNLAKTGLQIPKKENQVRPLAKLTPEQQVKIWGEAVDLAQDGQPTGASVKRLVDKHISSDEEQTKPSSKNGYSDLDRLRLENQHLKERLKQNDAEREKRAAEVAKELERQRAENRQLRSQLADMTAKYEAVLARLESIEKGK